MNHYYFTKASCFIISLVFAFSLNAQNIKNPVKEIGIGLTNLESFSLQYRWGTDQKLNRITGGLGFSLTSNNSDDWGIGRADLSGTYSILNLISINEKFGFLAGPSMGINFSRSITFYDGNNDSRTTNFSPRLGIVLGAYLKINETFYIYGDINPYLHYTFSEISGDAVTNRNFNSFGISNLNNSGAMITLAYRFQTGPE